MKLISVICVIHLLYLGVILCLWEEFAGPYYIKIKQMSRCRRMGRDSVIYSTKLHKVNRTHHGYTANVTFENDVDGWIQMYVVTKGTNGRWNSLVDVSMDACELIEKFAKQLLIDIYESANKVFTCPIKKGTYNIKNYLVDPGKVTNIPVLPYGDYRLDLSVYTNHSRMKILETCFSFYYEVRPLYEIVRVSKNNNSTTQAN